jgi:hypothetical protein
MESTRVKRRIPYAQSPLGIRKVFASKGATLKKRKSYMRFFEIQIS